MSPLSSPAMSTLATLLKEIDAFCRFAGISESTFGRRAACDGKFVGRLRDGADTTLGTLDKVRAYMVEQRAAIAAERRQPRRKAA